MLASKIEAYEADFSSNKTDAQGEKYDFTVDNSRGFPLAYLTPKSGITGFFYEEKTAKDLIVLHYTCGFLKGDIATLVEKDTHMSVHFVIGRNGVAYQLFNTNFWSYHLGKGTVGGNAPNSRRSIAIEISNIGPLTVNGSNLLDCYGKPYCSLSETDYYTKIATPFRGYQYFASFTKVQYATLKSMLTHFCSKWSIPKTVLPETKRYQIFESEATVYKGICTHVNYRPNGKTDIGPAFDWGSIV